MIKKSCNSYLFGSNNGSWRGGKIKKICEYCGKEFSYFPSEKRKVCSRDCSDRLPGYWRGKKRPPITEEWRRNLIQARIGKGVKEKIEAVCKFCNKIFYVHPFRKNTVKYCSHSCQYKFRKGKRSYAWKGGKIIRHGYIFIYKPDHPFAIKQGYIRRSHLVMEKKLGRYIKRYEVVHHINGVKNNDSPKNLKLFTNNREHINFHYK